MVPALSAVNSSRSLTHCILFANSPFCFLRAGVDPLIYLFGDYVWQLAGWIGSAVVLCFDALMVARRVKLAMGAVWLANCTRLSYMLMFVYSAAPYMRPLSVCISTECFSVQTVRLQVHIQCYTLSLSISVVSQW
jgi:hypothetical protein